MCTPVSVLLASNAKEAHCCLHLAILGTDSGTVSVFRQRWKANMFAM